VITNKLAARGCESNEVTENSQGIMRRGQYGDTNAKRLTVAEGTKDGREDGKAPEWGRSKK